MSYAWNWTGRCRATGRIETFYTKGPYVDLPSLRDHVECHYPGLTFVDGGHADGPPKRVMRPVNPRYFMHGILDLVNLELGRGRRAARPFGTIGDVRRRLGVPVVALTPSATPASRLSAAASRLR